EMDTRRLERLEKAGGEAKRNDVLDPRLSAVTGRESKRPRIRQRRPVEIRQQRRSGLVVGDMGARVDIAVPDPVLERNSPLPPRRTRRRPSQRQMIAAELARHRKRPVARQPLRPILKSGLERLLDQQPAKAGAIDEKIR